MQISLVKELATKDHHCLVPCALMCLAYEMHGLKTTSQIHVMRSHSNTKH